MIDLNKFTEEYFENLFGIKRVKDADFAIRAEATLPPEPVVIEGDTATVTLPRPF